MFISDIITDKELDSLKDGDSVAIWSQTGSGKSYFIKNRMNKYCARHGWKCLLVTNRKILKNQNEKELRYLDNNTIRTINYQELENNFRDNFYDFVADYKVLVFDEAHYFLSDSEFNRNTDILFNIVKNPPKDKICFFMTATSYAIRECGVKFTKEYEVKKDYSYIDKIYFYSSEDAVSGILNNLPDGEKAIYFCMSAKDAYSFSKSLDSAAFICSENNKQFYRRSSMNERANIISKERFDCKILCTTKVLDNGVNIKDRALKHVLIDMIDPVTFVQCLGRKRVIDEEDKISLYVKDYPSNQIRFMIKRYRDKIFAADELIMYGKEEFLKKYKKKCLDDIIDNDMTVNMAKYSQCKFILGELKKILDIGYRKYICEILSIDEDRVFSAESFFEKHGILDVLKKWENKKMFSEEQEKFKEEFFDSVFEVKSRNYRRRGLKSINAIIEEDGLEYMIMSNRESSGENRNKRYWELVKVKC